MAGTDSFVRVAPDSTGARIRNFINTILGVDVFQQVVTLAKSDGTVLDDVSRSSVTQPVSGAFFQATQPVSATALPLPTGAATDAGLGVIAADLAAQARLVDTQPVSIAAPITGTMALSGEGLEALRTLRTAVGHDVLHPRRQRLVRSGLRGS